MEVAEEPTNPITKVVNLLHELQAQVIADEKADNNTWNRYECWCRDTLDAKATLSAEMQGIMKTEATENLSQLATAKSESIISAKKQELIDEQNSFIQKITNKRNAERADFESRGHDLALMLSAVFDAITVLSGAGTKEALEASKASLLQKFSNPKFSSHVNALPVKSVALLSSFLQDDVYNS